MKTIEEWKDGRVEVWPSNFPIFHAAILPTFPCCVMNLSILDEGVIWKHRDASAKPLIAFKDHSIPLGDGEILHAMQGGNGPFYPGCTLPLVSLARLRTDVVRTGTVAIAGPCRAYPDVGDVPA
jgi:hypothetical protein